MNPDWKTIGPGVMERDYGALRGWLGTPRSTAPACRWVLKLNDEDEGIDSGDCSCVVRSGGPVASAELAADACDKAVEAVLAAIEAKMPLTVARALRTPEARRGVPIRFRHAEPTATSDGRTIIRYNRNVEAIDYLDDAKDWLPYALAPDDLERPAELMLDGVDMEGYR